MCKLNRYLKMHIINQMARKYYEWIKSRSKDPRQTVETMGWVGEKNLTLNAALHFNHFNFNLLNDQV